ncbi:MAG: hypothetical protein U1E34_04700 [Amaricoccus sp.]
MLKAADAPATCRFDWRNGYLVGRERIISDLGWGVQPHQAGAGDLVVVVQQNDRFRSWATLAGGRPGRFYFLSNRVRTSDDRVLCRSVVVRIALGQGPH